MPHQRRARIFKPRHEKSHKELQVQERKRVNGLLGKAHQLFVKCDAKVALIVQYERTGRIYSYRSHDWPLSIHLKELEDPKIENLSTSDFTDSGKRKPKRVLLSTKKACADNFLHFPDDQKNISLERVTEPQLEGPRTKSTSNRESGKKNWLSTVLLDLDAV